MALNKTLIAITLLICLAAIASSYGYLGTVSTGTGILSPIPVGKSTASQAEIGGLSILANYTGSWSADLKGTPPRHLDLVIFQERELILGSGQIFVDSDRLNVTAAGWADEKGMTVFISPVGKEEVFRLDLSASGVSITGKYDVLFRGGKIESGMVTGSMILSVPPDEPVYVVERASALPAANVSYASAVQSLGQGGSSGQTINRNIYKK